MKHTLKYQQFLFVLSIVATIFMFYYASWAWCLIGFLYYKFFVGLVGNQIAQHRYFSHNSFSTSKIKHYFLYFSSLTTGVNPVYYANAHRHHHLHSDQAQDVHSPCVNGWHIFSPVLGVHQGVEYIHVSKILDKSLRKINQYWFWIFAVATTIIAVINWKVACFVILPAIFWNYSHMIVFRVWLAHWKIPGSYQNFDVKDNSYNHQLIHMFDLGEGLHNNHHRYPTRYNQATRSGEFDFAGWVVKKFFIQKHLT
jgi:stearoyl-CoA desaturase (delta-9 desaturase)